MMRTFISVTLGLLAINRVSDAQARPRSDSLPRELVTALLGGSIGGPAIDVQPGLADSLLPAEMFRDAQILGYGDFRGTVMTVAYFPYAPQPTVDTIRARLLARGWKAPARDTVRGFVNSYGNMYSQAVCGTGSVVMPTVRIRSLNRTLAVISRQVNAGYAAELCSDSIRSMGRMRVYNPSANTPLPALEPPPGMESRGGGSTGTADNDRAMEMNSSLIGALPIEDMMMHYSQLFTSARWRKTDELKSSTMAMMAFETTANGERWHCAFSINIGAPNTADVRLSLRRF
jgi:hypothetical protein